MGKCKDCKFAKEIKPPILNDDKKDIAHGLADCLLMGKIVILSDNVCNDFKNRHTKKEIKKINGG